MPDIKIDKEIREAIELMYLSYRAFTSKPDQILEKRGLNRAHHRILYFVGKTPDLSINDLLEALSISKQALHIPLSQLVAMRLVERRKSVQDGRVKLLRLSASGRRLEARLTGAQALHLNAVFTEAGCDAQHAWRQVMRAIMKTPEDR